MKNVFSLIAILLLVSFPAFAEESSPAPISIHIETQLGANLIPDATVIDFGILSVPFIDDWVTAPQVINWQISWRGGAGSNQQLICELTSPLQNAEGTIILDPAECIQQVWTGVINVALPGPPADGSPQLIGGIGSSSGSNTLQLEMQFFNKLSLPQMVVDGIFTYTVLTGL